MDKPVKTKAVLCRTNVSILNYLLDAVQNKEKVFVLADLQDLWSKMYHISALASGNKPRYANADLRRFNNMQELFIEAEHNPTLKKLLNISQKLMLGRGTHGNIVAIKEILADSPEQASFTIATGHKSKGLEWDEVQLDEDMLSLQDDYDREAEISVIDALRKNQTLNLLYVAVTRAKYRVILPASIQDVLNSSSELRQLWSLKDREID